MKRALGTVTLSAIHPEPGPEAESFVLHGGGEYRTCIDERFGDLPREPKPGNSPSQIEQYCCNAKNDAVDIGLNRPDNLTS